MMVKVIVIKITITKIMMMMIILITTIVIFISISIIIIITIFTIIILIIIIISATESELIFVSQLKNLVISVVLSRSLFSVAISVLCRYLAFFFFVVDVQRFLREKTKEGFQIRYYVLAGPTNARIDLS